MRWLSLQGIDRVGATGRSAAATAGLQATSFALAFVASVLLARLLGAAEYGAYAYAIAWASILGVPALLGLDRMLIREIAAGLQRGSWGLPRVVTARARRAVVGASGVSVAVGACIAVLSAPRDLVAPILIGLGLVPLTALGQVQRAALQGLGRAARGHLAQSFVRPALLVALLAILFAPGLDVDVSPEGALALHAAAAAGALVVGAVLLRRVLPAGSADIDETPLRWASSAPVLTVFAGLGMLNAQLGTLIVAGIAGTAPAGLFAIATRAAGLVTLPLVALSAVVAARLSALHAASDTRGLERLLRRSALASGLAAAPVALVVAALGPRFLRLFGEEFQDAYAALAILVGAQLLNAAFGPVGVGLIMTGRELAATLGLAAAVVLNAGLAMALVPRWHETGAAVAAAASIVANNAFFAYWLRRSVGVRPLPLGRRAS